MSYIKYYLFFIIIIIGFISFSCSKNSTGIADFDINFPNNIGSHWTYEIEHVIEFEFDTVDVDIFENISINDIPATRWSFDYHCIIDTFYFIINDDTLTTTILCLPTPDTCLAVINADSVTLLNGGFFSFDKFVMHFPLSLNKKWSWEGAYHNREIHNNKIISIDTLTVKDVLYNNVYEIRGYHDIGFIGSNFDYIITVYWYVNGVGIIKTVESKIKTVYENNLPTQQYVGIISWELMDYSIVD